MSMSKNKNNRAFTIIELLVVIAIIAVLAAIVSVNVMSYLSKARNVRRLVDIKNYVNALKMAAAEDGSYPYDPTSTYYCLGHYSDGNCGFNGSYHESDAINNNLQRFIPGLPSDEYRIDIPNGDFWGYMYECKSDLRTIMIGWMMEGKSQSCGVGTIMISDFGGNTFCQYLKSL